jgi:hypothetical protein
MLNDVAGVQDAITGLRSPTHYGRPNLDQIFQKLKKEHPGQNVGVFFCGPKPFAKSVYQACNKYTDASKNGTKFFFHKENF